MSKTNDVDKRTLTLERVFNAPVQLVWQAWSQAEHIAHWWGPKGMQLTVLAHDFKAGSEWKYSMPMPNGKDFISEGKYSDIVELEKIVSSADFKPMTEGVEIHALFQENGAKTNFTFNVIHLTEEYCKQQEEMGFHQGWGAAFDRLESFLSTLNPDK